jgi:hypothetical protein
MQDEQAAPQAAAALAAFGESRGGVLDPIDRNSEILFGLFMVLTFTGTLSVATAGAADVRTMLIAAIGCNIAWGFVDAVMYVLRGMVARGRQALLGRTLRGAGRVEDSHRLIADAIGPLAAGLGGAELERLRQWIVERPAAQRLSARPSASDLKGALAVFLLVFVSTFPVVLPFVFFDDLRLAMRVSSLIALAIMFRCGWVWGRYAGLVPWRAGLTMMLLGVAVEAIVIALGG